MKIGCIIHGRQRLRASAIETLKLLKSAGLFLVEERTTSRKGEAIELARKLGTDGCEVIVAVGGDGTCNEVVNGIMQLKARPKFAIIPNGTGNDFHRMIGDFSPELFVKAIASNDFSPIDVCLVKGKEKSRYALNIAGFGLDATVISIFDRQRTKFRMGGKISYSLAILRAFLTYQKPTLALNLDGRRIEGKLLLTAVCNGKVYGHGLTINPFAELNNGKLNITLIGDISLLAYLRNISKLKKGLRIDHPEVHYFEAETLKIEPNSKKTPLQADGELIDFSWTDIHIIPSSFELLQPA